MRTETIKIGGGRRADDHGPQHRARPDPVRRHRERRDAGERPPVNGRPSRRLATRSSLQWTGIEVSQTADAIFGLNTAQNFDQFRDGRQSSSRCRRRTCIYADTAGNIGYQAPGRIPIRSRYMEAAPGYWIRSGLGLVLGLEGLRAVRVDAAHLQPARGLHRRGQPGGDRERDAVPHDRVGLRLPQPADPRSLLEATRTPRSRPRRCPTDPGRHPQPVRPDPGQGAAQGRPRVDRRLHQAGAGPAARLGLHQPGRRQRAGAAAAYYNAVWSNLLDLHLQRRAAQGPAGRRRRPVDAGGRPAADQAAVAPGGTTSAPPA